MQPDFMKMAQQSQANAAPQAAPQGAPMAAGQQGAAQERVNVVENLTQLAQAAGMQNEISKPELDRMIQELADAIVANDESAMENSKLYQMLTAMFEEARKMPEGQQQPQQQQEPQQAAAPKNFAGMMPPGGGMSGR
jgi:regulator of replication initiation timing